MALLCSISPSVCLGCPLWLQLLSAAGSVTPATPMPAAALPDPHAISLLPTVCLQGSQLSLCVHLHGGRLSLSTCKMASSLSVCLQGGWLSYAHMHSQCQQLYSLSLLLHDGGGRVVTLLTDNSGSETSTSSQEWLPNKWCCALQTH